VASPKNLRDQKNLHDREGGGPRKKILEGEKGGGVQERTGKGGSIRRSQGGVNGYWIKKGQGDDIKNGVWGREILK